jgi:DMSO/TMAO reductase YedYZ heme-binding membrane subunit
MVSAHPPEIPFELGGAELSQDEFEDRLIQTFTIRWLIVLLGVPVTYAIVRYHVFSGIDWSHFPLFIANKGIALAAVVIIATSYLIGRALHVYENEPKKRLILVKFCGLIGFSLASVHALMSLLLISPAYYPKFFVESGKMNFTGELTMVFGVLSLWCLAITAITSLPFMYDAVGAERWQRGQRMGYLSLGLAAGHGLVMGWSGWLTPGSWHGGLPPVSLVGFIAAMVPLLFKMFENSARAPTA